MSSFIRGAAIGGVMALFGLSAYAEGDPAKGEKVFKKCMACHTIDEGGANKVGPNLYHIVGRKTASIDGFPYSGPMKKLGEEEHIWTPEELDGFLENPKTFLPGTKMAFAGLKKPEERADLLAYLVSLQPEAEAPAEAVEAPAKVN